MLTGTTQAQHRMAGLHKLGTHTLFRLFPCVSFDAVQPRIYSEIVLANLRFPVLGFVDPSAHLRFVALSSGSIESKSA